MIRAVAWDIDGTLIDSEPLHHEALVHASLQFGVDLRDLPGEAYHGVHVRDVWITLRHRFPQDLDREVWMTAIEAYYEANRRKLKPIDGAVEVVRLLSKLGVLQACVSNSRRVTVDANIAALGIAENILFSVSLDDVDHGKPDPHPYRLAIRKIDMPRQDIIAVEDSDTGARSARTAGLKVVGYRVGEAARDSIDWRIDSLAQVIDIASPLHHTSLSLTGNPEILRSRG
jgi:HAD superfamily hydrolase (TIGR01509 family)